MSGGENNPLRGNRINVSARAINQTETLVDVENVADFIDLLMERICNLVHRHTGRRVNLNVILI